MIKTIHLLVQSTIVVTRQLPFLPPLLPPSLSSHSAAAMSKAASRRSDSFHSVGSTPTLSPSPPPPLRTAPPPLLLLPPPPPPSAFPRPPGKTAPVNGDSVVEEAAFRRILKRSEGKERLKMASHGFRVSQAVLCLVSLSVMAANRTRGWSGDSFLRYREYRFFLSVNVIGFLYAGFQLCDLACHVIVGKHVIAERLGRQFEFLMDQIMAYLLLSAASAAATRVDDWELNWGKDQFTIMASASVGIAFVAFVSFALSSLVSGYNLCNQDFA